MILITFGNLCRTQEPVKTISLVRNIGSISVAKSVIKTTISFEIQANGDLEVINNWILSTKGKLLSLAKMPSMKNSEEDAKAIMNQVMAVSSTLSIANESIVIINKYSAPGIKSPALNPCSGYLKSNIKMSVLHMKDNIQVSFDDLTDIWNSESIAPNSDAHKKVSSFLNNARSTIYDLNDQAQEHLHILEAITSGKISPALAAKIQQLDCIKAADFDKITLVKCTKIDTGLLCDFNVEVYSDTTTYKRYIPINYNGVSVEIPQDQILVKSADNDEMGLINCPDKETSIVNSCTFKTWDPAKHLFEKDPVLAIDNNNFTFNDDTLPLQLPDHSVLIMDKDLDVVIKSDGLPDNAITNLSPFILSFFKSDTLTLNKDKMHYSFMGALETKTVTTQVSIFNETTINLMKLKAIKQ